MEENSTTSWIIVGVGVLIVIIGAWWITTHGKAGMFGTMATSTSATSSEESTTEPSDSMSTSSAAPTNVSTMANGEAVSIADQKAGEMATISSVTLSKPGWVAIRDERGWTLGAGWFDTGTHTAASIPLLRATEAGKRYQALLYIDTAGDHTFDLHGETLVTNADGSVAGSMFTAQ